MSAIQLVMFDDSYRDALKPLSSTRPVCDFRIGILTIREKWEKHLKSESTTATAGHLEKWNSPFSPDPAKVHIWINSRVLPNPELCFEVVALKEGEALIKGDLLIACNCGNSTTRFRVDSKDHLSGDFGVHESKVHAEVIHRIADVFTNNGAQIIADVELMKPKGKLVPASNQVFGNHPVIMMKGSIAEGCIFNTAKGPIYIGENAEIMEGAMLRGPVCVGDGAQVKMGAKIYGDTTIGPGCKAGGEITNSVFFANSNKAHDGYVGNSVIGEWCNLGADTNTSNLKNNYGDVSVYNYAIGGSEDSGMQFHGLIMGDHSKCGINTMFNTGTVAGVGANIFGGGFPKKFIPDFSWGGESGVVEFQFDKFVEMVQNVYKRRSKTLSDQEIVGLKHVFDETKALRK
jgi:UDP-N-acetylglucosamine diphosphorylase/glucosamine-1-phosphate N-acetyltransferase